MQSVVLAGFSAAETDFFLGRAGRPLGRRTGHGGVGGGRGRTGEDHVIDYDNTNIGYGDYVSYGDYDKHMYIYIYI